MIASQPTVIRVEDGPGRKAWIYGDGRVIYPACKAARCARRYDIRRRAVEIPRSSLDDVLAAIESQNGVDDVRIEVAF